MVHHFLLSGMCRECCRSILPRGITCNCKSVPGRLKREENQVRPVKQKEIRNQQDCQSIRTQQPGDFVRYKLNKNRVVPGNQQLGHIGKEPEISSECTNL